MAAPATDSAAAVEAAEAVQDPQELQIKTMRLYSHVARVYNELHEIGVDINSKDAFVSPETLLKLPGLFLNYGGLPSVELALEKLHLNGDKGKGKTVVDVGAGLGQPARVMALRSPELHVIGVELQADQVEVGNKLSRVVGLPPERCQLYALDFNKGDLIAPVGSVDGVLSWLCILHMPIEERLNTWARSSSLLKPGGKLYVEDFFRKAEFTPEELKLLERDVYCKGTELPTQADYIRELEEAGFENIEFIDMTEEWATFCKNRLAAWEENKERTIRIQNEATFQDLSHFYTSVVNLWQGNHLGGVRVVATKKSQA